MFSKIALLSLFLLIYCILLAKLKPFKNKRNNLISTLSYVVVISSSLVSIPKQ